LLYNKKNKVRDASRARSDRLACLTGSLAKYVITVTAVSSHSLQKHSYVYMYIYMW
jgi:hypothetical protein